MKRAVCALVVLAILAGYSTPALAYVSVHGYYRKNGTYVEPYVRSNPNGLRSDNYGYRGGDPYNPSYYSSSRSHSSSWNTPSYETDSTYYTGKSLYQSRRLR